MRSLLFAGACAASMAFAGGAQATVLSDTFTITGSGAGSVGYLSFNVTSAGFFDLYTMGPTIDPQIYLFSDVAANGTVDAVDGLLASNDDSCPTALCGFAGSAGNSLISINLLIGSYILAVSDWSFSEAEARSGLNINSLTGDVGLFISNDAYPTTGGVAALGSVSAVPLPASLPLLLGGLGFLGFARRRKAA